MSDFTPRANLRLPGGGSTGTILPDEQVDIDVLNDNFRKIDALLGARNIPSASSYSGSMDGDLVYARDTEFLHMFSTTAGGLITPRLPGARQYSGTQAERVAFASKAKDGDLWRDTDNIGVIWVLKAGTPNTWVYSGNKLRGGRTAMDKLVTDGMAVEGMTVFNTTDNTEYARTATAWIVLVGPWQEVMPHGTPAADGVLIFNPGWSKITSPYWNGVRYRRTLEGIYIAGACSKSSSAAALEQPIAVNTLLTSDISSYLPATYAAVSGYIVAVPAGNIHIASASSAGAQVTFGGTIHKKWA